MDSRMGTPVDRERPRTRSDCLQGKSALQYNNDRQGTLPSSVSEPTSKMQHNLSNCRVLLVDDTKINLDIIVAALRDDYKISVATSGAAALDQVKSNPPDLILLDIMMPGMDGYEVCSRLKANSATKSIPVIFITAMSEIGDKSKGFGLGAVDYITKPFQIMEVKARVRTHLSLKRAMQALENQNQILDAQVRERTRAVRETQLEIIYRLSRAAEYRDNDTGMHIKRMSHYCRCVATAMDCDDETVELIFNASPLHDIGKIGVPDHILLKPSSLDPAEWEIMKSHTTMGSKILEGHDSLLIKMGQIIALTHHEKWDGSGYPQGLSQYQIPLAGRIVAICDVFDALGSKRPYKEPWPLEDALDLIRKGNGVAFDPRIVECFFKILPELLCIKEEFSDSKEDTDQRKLKIDSL